MLWNIKIIFSVKYQLLLMNLAILILDYAIAKCVTALNDFYNSCYNFNDIWQSRNHLNCKSLKYIK
jgi:hypothetical protein